MKQTPPTKTLNGKLLPLLAIATAIGFAAYSRSGQSPFVAPPTPRPVAPPPGITISLLPDKDKDRRAFKLLEVRCV